MKKITVASAVLAALALAGCAHQAPEAQHQRGDDLGELLTAPLASPEYSDAEWHWAQGWCDDNMGGIHGVPLWASADRWPVGFTDCVERQLPRAAAGISAGLVRDKATGPQVTYCIDSAPPAVANDYDRAWDAYDKCLASEFGLR